MRRQKVASPRRQGGKGGCGWGLVGEQWVKKLTFYFSSSNLRSVSFSKFTENWVTNDRPLRSPFSARPTFANLGLSRFGPNLKGFRSRFTNVRLPADGEDKRCDSVEFKKKDWFWGAWIGKVSILIDIYIDTNNCIFSPQFSQVFPKTDVKIVRNFHQNA